MCLEMLAELLIAIGMIGQLALVAIFEASFMEGKHVQLIFISVSGSFREIQMEIPDFTLSTAVRIVL